MAGCLKQASRSFSALYALNEPHKLSLITLRVQHLSAGRKLHFQDLKDYSQRSSPCRGRLHVQSVQQALFLWW